MTAGRLAERRILAVGAGTQPSEDIDAPPGNGRAISVRAAEEGATVICADRARGAAEETVARVEREAHVAASVIAADITQEPPRPRTDRHAARAARVGRPPLPRTYPVPLGRQGSPWESQAR